MNDKFLKQMIQFNESCNRIYEMSYVGNIGLHELALFYQKANPDQVSEFESLLKNEDENSLKQAWDLIQRVTNTRLVGLNNEKL